MRRRRWSWACRRDPFGKKEEEPDSDRQTRRTGKEAPDSEPGEGGEEKPFQKDTAGTFLKAVRWI